MTRLTQRILKQKKIFYWVIIGLLVISLSFNLTMYRKVDAYERYLSGEINNLVRDLVFNIERSHHIIETILSSNTIDKRQASSLSGYFSSIALRYQDLEYIGFTIDRFDSRPGSIVLNINQNISFYFDTLENQLNSQKKMNLHGDRLEDLKKVKQLLDGYKKVVSSIPGLKEEVDNNRVARNDWVNLLTNLEEETHQLESTINRLR